MPDLQSNVPFAGWLSNFVDSGRREIFASLKWAGEVLRRVSVLGVYSK